MHNRVAGGFYPPAPTTPRMRVRTGRFLRIAKDHHERVTSNAGCVTNRRAPFARSGAIGSSRLARLTRCRRFGPSPCPTHYGGHLATMPSADFCLITPGVTARRAARVPVGSGGWLQRFRAGPQAGSHADHNHRRVRWRFQPFPAGPQFDSPSGTDRK
jgi:hypothetical protein